ncbi:MAG: hypothetical protein R3C01_10715 [Planctomycetaceae bacterium]
MWCPHCQADLASEISADGQSMLCTSCSQEIRKVFAPSLHPETQNARELLSRWASEDLFSDDGDAIPEELPPVAPEIPVSKSASPPRTIKPTRDTSADDKFAGRPASGDPSNRARPAPESSKPKFRIDSAHPSEHAPATPPRSTPRRPSQLAGVGHDSTADHEHHQTNHRGNHKQQHHASQTSNGRRHDSAHAVVGTPHFDVQRFARPEGVPGKGESLWGQLLAYAGVAVLTVGTVLVLYGHFGGVENYSSTGWLVATGGQMLLMLGVVTLISGGMQQTTHEVTERVQYIGERMIRIEQSTQDILRGPHFLRDTSEEQVPTTQTRYQDDAEPS